jgi:hypothetical protein
MSEQLPPHPAHRLRAVEDASGEPSHYGRAIIAAAQAEAARISQAAAERVDAVGSQIDDLQRLREELELAVRGLADEYEGALHGLEQDSPAAQRVEGEVVVNAGPFTDMATLGAFERALARLPDVEDVCVRGLEGNRALIDVRLASH